MHLHHPRWNIHGKLVRWCFASFAVSLTVCPLGSRAWTEELLILSLCCPVSTPPGPSDNSQSSREKHTFGGANFAPWGSESEVFNITVSLSNSDDTLTLAEYCSFSGFGALSPPPSPLPLHLIWRDIKKAWMGSAVVMSWEWDVAFLCVAVGPFTCRACNQSTVSVFKGKLMQVLCEPGRFAASSSPRRLASEKMSEQLTVMGKDVPPVVARGSDTSSFSPECRLWKGNEKFVEELSPPALKEQERGNTVMFSVQPRSSR